MNAPYHANKQVPVMLFFCLRLVNKNNKTKRNDRKLRSSVVRREARLGVFVVRIVVVVVG